MLKSILSREQEVQEMLISIYCYWQLLTKRFMDYGALSLRAACVFDVCPGVRERLRLVPVEQCDFVDSYLAEDTVTRTKRKQLQQTKERLEKVDAILGGHSGTSDGIFQDMMSIENIPTMTLDTLAKDLSPIDTDQAATNFLDPHSFYTATERSKKIFKTT